MVISKRDHHKRSAFFVKESFQHSARSNLYMVDQLLSQHLQADKLTLDPFGGVGSSLLALDHGMPIVIGDLVGYWAKIAQANLEKLQGGRLLAHSTPGLVCQWDCRALPLKDGSVAQVITSPPYGDVFSNWHAKSLTKRGQYHPDWGPAYSLDPANLGNIHIYEHFLGEIALCLAEIWRTLAMGGKMVVIIKNYVRGGKIVDLTKDFSVISKSYGFELVERASRKLIPSLYANLNRIQNPNYPDIEEEMVLVFEKVPLWQPETRILIVMPAKSEQPLLGMMDLATRPAWRKRIFLHKKGFAPCFKPNKAGISPEDSFRTRKEWAFQVAEKLVLGKWTWAGCALELHGSEKLTKYLKLRLETLGCVVTEPAQGLNYGQKLAFYKEKQ